MIRQLLFNN